jgi:hypothetical protein
LGLLNRAIIAVRKTEAALQAEGANLETDSNDDNLLPSIRALKDSLKQQPADPSGLGMLTPEQLELLRQAEIKIDEWFAQHSRLDDWRARLKAKAQQDTDRTA